MKSSTEKGTKSDFVWSVDLARAQAMTLAKHRQAGMIVMAKELRG